MTGGVVNSNFEKVPAFNNIQVSNCPNFSELFMHPIGNYASVAYKFKENFVWDLSHLKITRLVCSMALQNLKKIILPNTIKEFSHSRTNTNSFGNSQNASDGSSGGYSAAMSPLETIIIAGT